MEDLWESSHPIIYLYLPHLALRLYTLQTRNGWCGGEGGGYQASIATPMSKAASVASAPAPASASAPASAAAPASASAPASGSGSGSGSLSC